MSQLTNVRGKSGRVRRSYNQLSYRALAKLPMGVIPAVCLPKPPSLRRLRRLRRRWSRAVSVVATLAVMVPMATFADSIYITYLAPKQEAPTAAQLTGGTTTSVTGIETFDTRPLAAAGTAPAFTKSIGPAGAITANFSGSFGIQVADQYGGAGKTGQYLSTFSSTGISIKLSHTTAVKGVNYLGLDISALDDGNIVELLREGGVLASFSSSTLKRKLTKCPDTTNPYCGNPTSAENAGEQYAYVNFFDLTGYFDEVKLKQVGGGGFEADNLTIGFREANVPFGEALEVPEPASALLLLPGLLGLLLARRRNQPGSRTAVAAA